MQLYRHTQIGYIILALLGTAIAVLVVVMLTRGATAREVGVFAVLVLVLFLFGTLTVEIRDDRLSFWFGIGLMRKSIPLAEIEGCDVCSFPWYYGWGIRFTPKGWLFNASGFTAVRLKLKNGKSFQLGTDDPDELCKVMTIAIGRSTTR